LIETETFNSIPTEAQKQYLMQVLNLKKRVLLDRQFDIGIIEEIKSDENLVSEIKKSIDCQEDL